VVVVDQEVELDEVDLSVRLYRWVSVDWGPMWEGAWEARFRLDAVSCLLG